jgi:hypothetical protein
MTRITFISPEAFEGFEGQDFCAIQEELRFGTRRAIPGFSHCSLDTEQNGVG